MMQLLCKGTYPGKSSVHFLPMIDMDPTDMTCIYSTLSFISDQESRYEYTPIITFDQPLWWKSLKIVSNEPQDSKLKSIILRLGGLYVEMSFLGCIGHIMAGSGIEEVLELVYAKNAVPHILSGKAVARAIRGHFLVDAALNAMLVSDTFSLPLSATLDEANTEEEPVVPQPSIDEDLESAKVLYNRLTENPDVSAEVCSSEALDRIARKLEEKKQSMLNNDRVNCDKSQAEGKKIMASLTGKNAHEYTFRKKDQVVTLACKTAVRLNDGDVQVDPQLMFQRLSIVATTGGFESPQQFFEYEMCSFPASLFDASLLPLKANKPVLADAIWSMTKESQTANDPGGSAYFVIDGGPLLHRVYVRRRYPRATIVFDGYDNGPTTKDCTHQRRGHGCGPAVLFDPDMLVTLKKGEFLSNQAKGDADVMIVDTAITKARDQTTTVLGRNVTSSILFVHALLGCDTTSRVHGIGKGIALKKAKINAQFRQLAGVFNRLYSSREDVIEAGEKALLSVFNAASTESLNSQRYIKYCKKSSHRQCMPATRESAPNIFSSQLSQPHSILASPGMETESAAATGLGLEAFRWAPPYNSHRSPTGTPVIVGNDPL
ncbi:unnamed protein product [Porites lobata]|uniref:Uncharacterized protein n=1 Tax=Porites lobata TaxID=104759 RepID=A0ABN8PWD6_9CNID|nr:unnamed protein product [Porites lobata]